MNQPESVSYFVTDTVASVTTGTGATATTHTYAYDPAGRLLTDTPSVGGTAQPATTYVYADASSSDPQWTTIGGSSPTSTSCDITGLDGNTLATLTTGTGAGVSINVVDLHGDVVDASPVTVTGSAGGSPTVTDEFGNTLTGTLASYGWVGAKAKVTDTSSGLVLMGARLYDSTTGLFLQRDPVYGGNTTTYGYPLDPLTGYDLNGMWWNPLNALKSAWLGYSRFFSENVGLLAAATQELTGGRCGYEQGLRVCYGGWHLFAKDGTTFGTTFVTSAGNRSQHILNGDWKYILRHEKKHRDLQWRRYGPLFPGMYLDESIRVWLFGGQNVFERQAGLCDGGYLKKCTHAK